MCNHRWRQVHEESLLGGYFPTGWKCEICGKFVSQNSISPSGLGGTISDIVELHGPHGLRSQTSSGKQYSRQLYNKRTKELIVEP